MNKLPKLNQLFEDQSLNSNLVIRPYVAITSDVHVTVWPEFIDSKTTAIGDLFIWSYQVRIDNKSNHKIKLMSRYWRIIDEKGIAQEVSGDGVIGEQPVIAPNAFYQYTSGVHLRYPSGIMAGKYQMKNLDNNEIFDIKIPTFSLDTPTIKDVVN